MSLTARTQRISVVGLLALTSLLVIPPALPDEPKNHDLDLIYDEARVPAYDLPPLLISSEGRRIATPEEWFGIRRPQIMALFGSPVYGVVPAPESPIRTTFEVVKTDPDFACIAPRPVYVMSGVDDKWADPRGEYLSAYHASEVYRLLGKAGLTTEASPPVGEAVLQSEVGYYIRPGGHSIEMFDWLKFLEFAEHHLKRNAVGAK
jgi:hypothetical protein